MLMAAGLGTRLRPFTELQPKALLPVMGIPCAQFALDMLSRTGVHRVVANVHHLAEPAREGLSAMNRSIRISDESGLLLGSAGGIAKALPELGSGAFFLMNADVICDADLAALARCHSRLRERHGVRLTLAVFPGSKGGGSYREILLGPPMQGQREGHAEGLIRGLGPLAQGRPYFVGVAVVEPEAFGGIGSSEPSELVPRVLEPAIRDSKAGFFFSSGCWLDIGAPELWARAHFELIKRMEIGSIAPEWRHRIESVNHRIGQEMWVSKRAHQRFPTADWWAPAYFNELGDPTAMPPRRFGANGVLYGKARPTPERFEDAIGYRGLFQKFGAGTS